MHRLLLGLLLFLPAHADEVILKGGTRLGGTVLTRDDKGLRLLTQEGTEIRVAAADISTVVKHDDAPQSGEWIRFKRGKRYGGDLQVALVHFLAPGSGRRVDLLSAVHIADPAYWVDVRRHLEAAEVVLFEWVKPKGVSVSELLKRKRMQRSEGALSGLQVKLARWFNLQFQLDAINYDRPHFVHADLEVGRPLADGEKGTLPKELRGLQQMLEMIGPALDKMMGDDTNPRQLKLRRHYKNVSARMLGGLGNNAALLFGPKVQKALLIDRNTIALNKLAGLPSHHRNVTIFYGGAHMADIAERLLKKGYTRAGGRWLNAWHIPD